MSDSLYIIGGSGFVGKNMVRCFCDKYDITIFDKVVDYNFFSQYDQVKVVEIALDVDKIPSHFSTPDYIINLASIVTAERDLTLFDSMVYTNIKVLLNLYERFKLEEKLKLFIQFGSSEEYGNICSPFEETMRENPQSPYAIIKQMTTNMAMMLYDNYGFPIMVVRPGNLFGPFQNKSKFLPYIITQLKNNRQLDVTLCEQKRDYIYIDDFIWSINQLLLCPQKSKGEIVNISSGDSISLKTIIDICKSELSSMSVVNYGAIPYRENEIMDLRCSIDKFERIINERVNFNVKRRIIQYVKL